MGWFFEKGCWLVDGGFCVGGFSIWEEGSESGRVGERVSDGLSEGWMEISSRTYFGVR